MEDVVQQSSVDKQCLEIANKELLLENDRLSIQIMSQDIVSTNDLKAQLQDKDTTICKLKDTIKSLRKNNKEEIVDHDRCDLATTNEELENSVAKLLPGNERIYKEINHVKQVFKDQFDSIKQTCVLQKEHNDSLINKLNLKSAKNKDLKAQIQDKVFVITSLKNDLRKLKGKATVDNATQIPSATTVAPGMFKLDLEPLAPKLVHYRKFYINYLKHTQEQADILRGIVEQAKAKQPLDNALDFALIDFNQTQTTTQDPFIYFMMATTDKESSAAGTDNHPPMLEESNFDSWKIRIQRYIRGKPNGKLIWNSIKNGPNPHPTITDTTGEGEQQSQNEILFDQYERFRANENKSIHDYFVRFHKLINDMKITKIQILAHQRNTKFLNNLPSYWSKYVTIVKNSQDISNVSYVNLYTHLKSYEQHVMKTLRKKNQSSGNTDLLAYMAHATKTKAKAFLADVECTALYDDSLAITTTISFEVSHEDAYDSNVDEAPHADAAFMANLTVEDDGKMHHSKNHLPV
nr:hypothetical protein [Tanacetum cinerariifolium]